MTGLKALEWFEVDDRWCVADRLTEETYHYRIERGGDTFVLRDRDENHRRRKIGEFRTFEAAKAFAQVDFERRIHGAIASPERPKLDVRKLIAEDESGERDGFLNTGDSDGNDAELACPHCGGSGHKDDAASALEAEPMAFDTWVRSEYEGVDVPVYWLEAMKHAWTAALARREPTQ